MELRVVRATDRFDEACRFYGEVLGWPVVKEWTDGGRGRIFGHGDSARIELLEVSDEVPPPVSGLFLSAEVDDLDVVIERLRLGDVSLVDQPTIQPWGHRNLAVLDPAGVRLVLFEVI
jgi:catechol 2,3-dioxygenase-like lactoylglutathione lyase family enzyme